LFQLVMVPSRFLLTIASSDESTIAARRLLARSRFSISLFASTWLVTSAE
jgi:hypothetical protein